MTQDPARELFEAPETTPRLMLKGEFANLMGVTGGRISQLIHLGFPVEPNGRIDPERNDGALVQRLLYKEGDGGGLSVSVLSRFYTRSALYRLIPYQGLPKYLTLQSGPTKTDRFQVLADDTVEPSIRQLSKVASRSEGQVVFALFPLFGTWEDIERKMNRV